VKIIKGSEGIISSALEAVKQWWFKPATLDGQPIPCEIPVAFSFSWPMACMGGPRTGSFGKSDVPSTPSFNPPAVVSSVTPVFPANALGAGSVVVSVSLDAAGKIQNVKIIKGSEGFNFSALEAIKQWRFKPATLDGQPIPSMIPVAFSFGQPIACMGGPRR
jgi:TonB family protein